MLVFLPFFDMLYTIKTFSTRFPQDCPQHFPQEFHAKSAHKIFPQKFPTRLFCKDFLQELPARFSHKIFPQDFPKLDPDWLAPHYPIPNAKFPPITALLNRPTYHKSAKVSPQPFPKSHGNPKSMNKLTLNEPAKRAVGDFRDLHLLHVACLQSV